MSERTEDMRRLAELAGWPEMSRASDRFVASNSKMRCTISLPSAGDTLAQHLAFLAQLVVLLKDHGIEFGSVSLEQAIGGTAAVCDVTLYVRGSAFEATASDISHAAVLAAVEGIEWAVQP